MVLRAVCSSWNSCVWHASRSRSRSPRLAICSGIGQAGPVKLGKQRGSRRGTQSRQQGVLLHAPFLAFPRAVITASKLIFIFDKKTRRERRTAWRNRSSTCFGSWHLLLLLLLVKLKGREEAEKTLFISEKWKVRGEGRPTVVEARRESSRVEAGRRCKSDSIIIKALFPPGAGAAPHPHAHLRPATDWQLTCARSSPSPPLPSSLLTFPSPAPSRACFITNCDKHAPWGVLASLSLRLHFLATCHATVSATAVPAPAPAAPDPCHMLCQQHVMGDKSESVASTICNKHDCLWMERRYFCHELCKEMCKQKKPSGMWVSQMLAKIRYRKRDRQGGREREQAEDWAQAVLLYMLSRKMLT